MKFIYTCKDVLRTALLAADGISRVWNNDYRVLYVLEGKGQLCMNGETMVLRAGAVYFSNPELLLEISASPRSDLVLIQVLFQLMECEDEEEGLYRRSRRCWLPDGEISLRTAYRIGSVMQELLAVPKQDARVSELQRDRLLCELLLLMQDQPQGDEGRSSGGEEPFPVEGKPWIQRTLDYMHEHYAEPITRDKTAALAGFHPRFFSKLFKEETGTSFAEYLALIRIRQAKEQLLLTRNNLNEIAQSVGYSNGLYLSRKFKELTGLSPRHYVKQPKRVVIYDWVGNLLALGIKPVGASYFTGLHTLHLLQEELAEVPEVGRTTVDAVISLEPELIVVPSWLGAVMIGKLQKIAPTLVVPYGDTLERFRHLADILDRREMADALIASYLQRAGEVRADIAGIITPGETVGLYELSESSIWVFGEFHGRGGYNLYKAMGFVPPKSIRQRVLGKAKMLELTLEELPAYAADHMFISYPFTGERRASVERLMQHPVWQEIPAFLHNRIYFIDRRLFHSHDVLSLIKQLEIQRELLLAHGRDV